MAALLFGIFFVLLLLGVPIATSLGAAGVAGLLEGDFPLAMLAPAMSAAVTKYTLLAVPFFILAGAILEHADISRRIIALAEAVMGDIRGGLAVVSVIVCCFFAAISGSSTATVAAVGGIVLPAMIKQGYDRGTSSALIAAAGTIGIVIPPSIAFVIYASMSETSVTALFAGGILPGLIEGAAFIACMYWLIRKQKFPNLRKYTGRETGKIFLDSIWGLMAPVIILGGIYTGIFTPTEAACVAVVYSLIVGIFIYKSIKLKQLFALTAQAVVSTSSVLFIVSAASIFAWIISTSGIAAAFTSFILGISTNKILILLFINIILIIAGGFIDSISAMYILLPIMLPIIRSLGLSLVWFGVMVVVNLSIGQFSPPVGVNLYVACNITGTPFKEIAIKIWPFVLAAAVALLIVTYIPQIALLLPNLLSN